MAFSNIRSLKQVLS